MRIKITWPNGHITNISAYFGETEIEFKNRILKAYGTHNVKIFFISTGDEGYHIK